MDNNLPIETAFTIFDMLALGTLVISVSLSAMRGLMAELIAFGGWLFSLILARTLCVTVAMVAFPNLQPPEMAVVMAFVLVFLSSRIVLHLLNYVLDYFIKVGNLTYVNRSLGGLIGLLKGLLFVCLTVLVCSFTSLPQKDSWQVAKTSRFFEQMAKLLVPTLPQFLGQQVAFPVRLGEEDELENQAASEPNAFSGSLKNRKARKQHISPNKENPPYLKNLPQGTSTE